MEAAKYHNKTISEYIVTAGDNSFLGSFKKADVVLLFIHHIPDFLRDDIGDEIIVWSAKNGKKIEPVMLFEYDGDASPEEIDDYFSYNDLFVED